MKARFTLYYNILCTCVSFFLQYSHKMDMKKYNAERNIILSAFWDLKIIIFKLLVASPTVNTDPI